MVGFQGECGGGAGEGRGVSWFVGEDPLAGLPWDGRHVLGSVTLSDERAFCR